MSWIKRTQTELAAQAINLANNVDANATALGLSVTDAANLELRASAYNAALQAKVAAEFAARASVSALESEHSQLTEIMSALNKKVQANPSVSDKLKDLVGFPVYRRPSRNQPNQPTDLTGKIAGPTAIDLRWKRNGNPLTAIFLVQTQSGNGPWTTLESVTRTRFRVVTDTPETELKFRIVAQVRGLRSQPSGVFTIWSPSEDLRLAA